MRRINGRTTGGLALGVTAIVIAAAGGAYAAGRRCDHRMR